MSRQIIAVDIDDVLTPHFQGLVNWYNAQYGTKLTLADNHPKSAEGWGTEDEKVAIRRVHNFFETEEFKAAKPFVNAQKVLELLSRRYEMVIVTARDTIIEQLTREWLDEHFQQLFSDVHFTAQYNLGGQTRSKAEVIRETGASYLIDDALDHIIGAAEAGITCVLFGDYPWNQGLNLPLSVTRCLDWAAVQEYFDGRRG